MATGIKCCSSSAPSNDCRLTRNSTAPWKKSIKQKNLLSHCLFSWFSLRHSAPFNYTNYSFSPSLLLSHNVANIHDDFVNGDEMSSEKKKWLRLRASSWDSIFIVQEERTSNVSERVKNSRSNGSELSFDGGVRAGDCKKNSSRYSSLTVKLTGIYFTILAKTITCNRNKKKERGEARKKIRTKHNNFMW